MFDYGCVSVSGSSIKFWLGLIIYYLNQFLIFPLLVY